MFDSLSQPAHGSLPATQTTPVRLLAVSGGGLLGIIAAAFLERLELLGCEAHGADYRLCRSFDLAGGTSTGAVLATAVALGLPAGRMVGFYLDDARDGFRRRLTLPGLRALFDATALHSHFARVTGARRLRRDDLACDLAVVVKNLETSTPVLMTTARGLETAGAGESCFGAAVSHAPVALDDLLRASTAAPGIFAPQGLRIGPEGALAVCVDGGLSPFNDPALLLYRYVRSGGLGHAAAGHPVELTALGVASAFRARHLPGGLLRRSAWQLAFTALRTMIADGMQVAEAELRRLAACSSEDLVYHRHDIALTEEAFALMGVAIDRAGLSRIRDPFDTRGKAQLYEIAALYAERTISAPLPLRLPRFEGTRHAAA